MLSSGTNETKEQMINSIIKNSSYEPIKYGKSCESWNAEK